MSCFRKDPNLLRCRSCEREYALSPENFPNDLFQLLSKYDLPQIHWFCKSCDRWKITQRDIAELRSRISGLELDITDVKKKLPGDREIDEGPRYAGYPPPEKKIRRGYVINLSGTSRDSSPDEGSFYGRGRSSSPSNSSIRSSDRSPPPKDKEANSILNTITSTSIKIDKSEAQHGKAVITDFMDKLIPYLKGIDPVFKFMFKREYRTGSSYNDLKISSADEYDVNIMFGLPSPFLLKVEFFELTKAFAKLKWSKTEEINDASVAQKSTLKFLEKNSKNFYLNPLDIRAWFQGLIDKFCLSNPHSKLIKKIINSQSGPARTIKICTTTDFQISIDLVPVFEFQFSDVFNNEIQIKRLGEYPLKPGKQFCSFIPKICVGEVQLLQSDCQLSWRLHVPELDKKVLNHQQFESAKPLIRLLKLLRDKNDWQSLASYHLLTVILWGIKECPDDYRNAFLYRGFLGALEQLQGYLKNQFLPYFLCDDYNLFHNLNADECTHLSNRIGNIIKKLDSDHFNLYSVFNVPNERN